MTYLLVTSNLVRMGYNEEPNNNIDIIAYISVTINIIGPFSKSKEDFMANA